MKSWEDEFKHSGDIFKSGIAKVYSGYSGRKTRVKAEVVSREPLWSFQTKYYGDGMRVG